MIELIQIVINGVSTLALMAPVLKWWLGVVRRG